MNYDTYGSNAVELAIDLANADRDDPEWARAFLGSHDAWFSPDTSLELTHDETARAGETADLVRAVAVAATQADVLTRLNELLALARPRPYATDHDGGDGPVAGRRAARLGAARGLLGGELRQRLRRHLAQRQPALLLQHLRQPVDRRGLPRPPEGVNGVDSSR